MKTVTAIARQYRVSPDTVRHSTRLGLLRPLRGELNGYRYFNVAEENKLAFILSARQLGCSPGEIKQILLTAEHGDTPCRLVRQLIQKRLIKIRTAIEIAESQRLALRLEHATENWRDLTDRMPSGDSICHLIEAWQTHAADPDSDNANRGERHERGR